jgi:chromosome segregation ATPase
MSGWKLSAALIVKQVSAFGDTVAQALVSFDPETATEVDRENLQKHLREAATKLASARHEYDGVKKTADALEAQIAQDTKAAAVLISKLEAKEIDESTLTEFADNLEDMKARLPVAQQDVKDAQELVDTVQGIVNTIEKKLADFDAAAKKALRGIAQAQANQERENLRLQNQQELRDLQSGVGGTSTALGALTRKAEKLQVQADATAIQANIGQKPLDRANAIDEARRIAAGTATPVAESAADRLRRLAGQ